MKDYKARLNEATASSGASESDGSLKNLVCSKVRGPEAYLPRNAPVARMLASSVRKRAAILPSGLQH